MITTFTYLRSRRKTTVNTGFFHRILLYSDRIRLNTEQNFPLIFLNNFPVCYCIRTHVTHTCNPHSLLFTLICENMGNYTNITTYTRLSICFEYLNKGFCIIPYSHNWYNVVCKLSRIFHGSWKLNPVYPGSLS